jgi:ATP-binding cassette subfamily B (MDR/TAP) protein 9
MKQAYAYIAYMSVLTALPLLVTALCLWYGGVLIGSGELTGGTLISFAFYQMSLSDGINSIGWVYSGLMDALGASAKVMEYIEREPKCRPTGCHAPHTVLGVIAFKDVQFHYPTRPDAHVLRGVSFTVNPGEMVALVGESGGGKSSCMALLQRFYDPVAGSITLDGVDIFEYDHTAYHKHVVIVGQEPVLTAATIKKNIGYALQPPPTDEAIETAARLANCHHFTTAMKNGYDTSTGEKGVQLSGGQKQRVAIARAREPRTRLPFLHRLTAVEGSHLLPARTLHRIVPPATRYPCTFAAQGWPQVDGSLRCELPPSAR